MKSIVAAILLVATIVSAEPPRQFLRQKAAEAPYEPSGWKPNGPLLQYPVRSNVQAYGAPEPQTIYGPPEPQSSYGPPTNDTELEPTTTETFEETTTLEPQAENIKTSPSSGKLQAKKSEKSTAPQPNQFFFIVNPAQSERLVLAPLRVTPVNAKPVAPIRAPARVAAPARLEEFPQVVEVDQTVPVQVEQAVPVQYAQVQAVPFLPGYVSQSSIVTPYSSSFVQIYQ
ncbi:uncharacterized protein LOC114328370 [Diabrotica virgifera virgifera]|uniref:Uncharacterized protein LOC114328370 n=1 Tax=Diabrotica virgifera virgifera TaxID=50390 RepID=A0A6P7FIZ6_DIAVI|nr:uncharacterized protein LOC114328370 [Diabrotica virgifera virgifera]